MYKIFLFTTFLITISSFSSERLYLSKNIIITEDSYWRINQDLAVEGTKLTMNGKVYNKGLSLHAPSTITFNIPKNCTHFHAIPGADDFQGGKFRMRVLVDGKEVYNTGEISRHRQKIKMVFIKLATNAKTLTLLAEDTDNDRGGDHANWADAYFMLQDTQRNIQIL